jgi:hypothetical protein
VDRKLNAVALALTLILALATSAPAQTNVSASDIQRLEDSIAAINRDLAALRTRDASGSRAMQSELKDLQDEVIYLKVKLRKDNTLPVIEYTDLRDRLEALKVRARGDEGSAGGYGSAKGSGAIVPVGTELDVRLQTPLNSGTAQLEDRFEATTLVDLKRDGRVLIPAGSVARGVVTGVKAAGRVDRKGSISLAFDRITVNGVTHEIRGTLLQAIESEGVKADAGRVGAGAAVGGILGGILGGWKGGLAGILVGGGGTMVATEGQQVDLKPGTVLRMRFDSELPLP